jgi:hypothetical protein
MGCFISDQIAVNADEPEQLTLSQILSELINNGEVYINNKFVEIYQITDSIDAEEMREAAQSSICGNSLAVYELYIRALDNFINE